MEESAKSDSILVEEGEVTVADESTTSPTVEILGDPDNELSSLFNSGESISPIGAATTDGLPKSVTTERKEELLLQARAERVKWIQKVSLPYRVLTDKRDPWNQDERLAAFRKCRASRYVPSAFTILSNLYGMGDDDSSSKTAETIRLSPLQVSDRIESVLGGASTIAKEKDKAIPSGNQVLAEAEAAVVQKKGTAVLTSFYSFLRKLQDPQAAMLVRGMRNFCRNLEDQVDDGEDGKAMLIVKIRSYLESTYESLSTHISWKSTMSEEGADELVRRSLESFLYGQCYELCQSICWGSEETIKQENEWLERIDSLQFVTPAHLEIDELSSIAGDPLDLDKFLEEPISALLNVDLYFSPYEKLQQILSCYHGVNSSLTAALNHGCAADASKRLPSADDVLPTIILVVLRARPANMLQNLQMIEDFSPADYLRGEQGYAYTNLYGAVQFLKDLDLDAEEPSKSLSISPAEFRKGLDECRAAAAARLKKADTAPLHSVNGSKNDVLSSTVHDNTLIPASAVREARLRGDKVNLEWAQQFMQAEQKRNNDTSNTSANEVESGAHSPKQHASATTTRAEDYTDGLPAGFSRSYKFLSTRPEDVKMSDLNTLLTEYKMLVSATETLIGERVSKAALEKKEKSSSIQMEIYATARKVDPSLLPTPTNEVKAKSP